MKLTPEKFSYLKKYRMPHGYDLVKRKRKLADEQFKIVTLGDSNIFTNVLDFAINTIFGLLGGRNDKITAEYWNQAMPGNGYWTTKYRNYLIKHFYYKDMLHKIPVFTQYFVHENLYEISGGLYQNLSTEPATGVLGEYVKLLLDRIAAEQKATGNFNNSGGANKTFSNIFSGGGDLQTIILIGAGIGILFSMINKKKR